MLIISIRIVVACCFTNYQLMRLLFGMAHCLKTGTVSLTLLYERM